jgi:hypothetical protein
MYALLCEQGLQIGGEILPFHLREVRGLFYHAPTDDAGESDADRFDYMLFCQESNLLSDSFGNLVGVHLCEVIRLVFALGKDSHRSRQLILLDCADSNMLCCQHTYS